MLPDLSADVETNWTELGQDLTVDELDTWAEYYFPDGLLKIDQLRVVYEDVSYGYAADVGEIEFLRFEE